MVFHLSQGDVWKLADHPDQENYPGQRIYFVIVEDYIYLVPHVVEKGYVFFENDYSQQKGNPGIQGRAGGLTHEIR